MRCALSRTEASFFSQTTTGGGRAGRASVRAHRRRSRDRRREGPPHLPGKLTAITVALQGGSMAAAGRCDAYADACTVAELCVREQTNRTREASVLSLTEAGAGAAQGPDPSSIHPSTPCPPPPVLAEFQAAATACNAMQQQGAPAVPSFFFCAPPPQLHCMVRGACHGSTTTQHWSA